ncbi:MAG: protein-L-isoaspartate(D-aspartate) O-methyltransferase [Candidatus Izemoplasmatales bacterium]|nr:protein-L-isoaspartate(D-aspartate) O-methyltransferase [Candidatus Izemoplasmatales bacterium]
MNEINFNEKRLNMTINQIKNRGISNENLIKAFLKVERHLFVEEELMRYAYEDYPLDIGYNQTISQPYIIALMIGSLNIKKSDKILEIGTGSGYQTAILSLLVREVYTIDINDNLLTLAKNRLNNLGYQNIHFKHGNGYFGWLDEQPFDKIIVSCATKQLPDKLIKQLKNYGKMVIPVDSYLWQELYLINKKDDKIKKKSLGPVRFVPMINK